jgi:hypothetical protein
LCQRRFLFLVGLVGLCLDTAPTSLLTSRKF